MCGAPPASAAHRGQESLMLRDAETVTATAEEGKRSCCNIPDYSTPEPGLPVLCLGEDSTWSSPCFLGLDNRARPVLHRSQALGYPSGHAEDNTLRGFAGREPAQSLLPGLGSSASMVTEMLGKGNRLQQQSHLPAPCFPCRLHWSHGRMGVCNLRQRLLNTP